MKRFALVAVAALLLLAGCSAPRGADRPHHPFSFRVDPAIAEVRRIAVLPFARAARIGRAADGLSPAMAAAIRELGLAVVVEVDGGMGDLLPGRDVVLVDQLSSDDLLRLRDRFNVDAVLIGRIDQFTSFDPISVGVTAHLVSCLDGIAVWSASGQFDGRRDAVQDDVRSWYQSHQAASDNSVQTWRTTLQSPGLFARYVGDRLAASMTAPGAEVRAAKK